MNNAEAIHKMEFMRDAYQKLIDENVDEGRFVGTDVTGTWKADTPLNEVYAEHVKALDLAISALEKQEKKPAKAKFNKRYNKFVYFCPVCGEVTGHYDYCSDCGQAIDYDNSEPYEAEEES